jgi:dihydrofolate reductase
MSSRRRIVTFDNVSADGYFAAPDGNLDWVVPDDEVYASATERMPNVDTMLFGRRTYQMFQSFWPHALDDSPAPLDPHDARRRSPAVRQQAVWINETPKVVFSRTLKDVTWKNSRLLPELDPREVEAMKGQPGNDMIIFGSGSIVSQLTRHGLIDEYMFVVNPIVLGSGRPLLSGVPTRSKLILQEAREFKSGNVMLRYARAR